MSSVEAGKSSVPIDREGHTKGGSFLACVEPGQSLNSAEVFQ